MVHQSQPNQDPARRHNIVHGRRTEIGMERYGEYLLEGVFGHGSRAEVECYG
jgi:hypothetical protein